MKRLTLFLAALFIAVTTFAFNNGLVEESVDPYADSVAIAKMRVRMDSIRKVRPTVALVLSGGGAKGASHAGVLKFLEEKGVPIDLIGGTSMGGLVGGLYSVVNDADQLCGLFRSTDWSIMMSDKTPIEYYSFEKRQAKDKYLVSMPFEFKSDKYSSLKSSLPDGGLYGFNIYNTINAVTVNYQDSLDFTKLPIPFYCVATEVNSNKEKNIFSGYLPEALRSTIAIPLVFKPVRKKDEVMLDGGMKNNFPIDIARAMGADIIIAVDLHTPDEPNDHIVNIMMNMLFGIGNHSYEKNKDASDIYIKPDMNGFWTMSFGKEEIAEIIQRGYDAAKSKEDEIDRLVAVVGKSEKANLVHNTVDLTKDKIKISSFGFEGMSDKDIRYFRNKIQFLPDAEYSAQDFEVAVAEIFSTGAFNSVRYKISGTQEPYSVIFVCEEGPNHTLDVGFRIDTEQIIAAIANFGFGKNKVSGWQMDATVRLSSCPKIDFNGCFTPMIGPKIGLSASSSLTNVMNFQNTETQGLAFNFWRYCGQVYIEDSRWSRVKLAGGARIDYSDGVLDFPSNSCVSAYADLKINSLNDSYFPTKGVRFSVGTEYVFSNITKDGWNAVNALYSRILLEVPITFCDRFTAVVKATGSDITGDSLISPYRFNTLGGTVQGRYFDRQLPLFCINGVMICDDKLVTTELDLRVRIGEKNYVSAIGDFFTDGPKWNELAAPDWGIGLQYSRPTRIGGLFANVHWNSYLNTVGIYVGLGKSF